MITEEMEFPYCHGLGLVPDGAGSLDVCALCNGEGTVEVEHECEECEGQGTVAECGLSLNEFQNVWVRCPRCDGAGVVIEERAVPVPVTRALSLMGETPHD